MKKATIADVARLAGVSIKTVSRVANNEPNVREQTRAKVQEAIEALNYRANPSARSLAARRSYLIGLIYDNPSASYLINVQRGALAASRAEGYDLVIHPLDYQDPGLVEEIVALVEQTKLDGLILTPPLTDIPAVCAALDESGTPYVRVAPKDRIHGDCAVYTNDEHACSMMVGYLNSLGHERIAFIIGHPDHGAVGNRLVGYKQGLAKCGLDFDPALVQQGYNSFESGQDCARALLESGERPTAIFASNDDMAAGAMKVAHEMGLRIPADLSVVGFDDVPLARQVWPSLTTIRQPIKALAERATELLLRTLRSASFDDLPKTIDSTLIVRDSSGPVHASAEA